MRSYSLPEVTVACAWSAARDGERSPCPIRRGACEVASALGTPLSLSVEHGGFVITSGGHRHPCLYRATTLAGFVSAVMPVGWFWLLGRLLLRSRFESSAQSF
jgi:hypothetical protein